MTGDGGMKPFSLLIKPASADCNLRCRYCFYLDRAALYPETRRHRMPSAVLERMVRSFLQTPQPSHTFAWQGGEPTLMGLPFYREATALQASLGAPGTVVANGFQTNGVLLDDDWAALFAEYRFLVGVSLDGPAPLHDRFRRDRSGRGTHARVLEGIAALRRRRVEYNILTLVSQANVTRPETVYDYLCEQDVRFHQYIECVELDAHGALQPFAVTAAQWGEFLCRLFDHWFRHDTHRVSVRLFDTILAQLVDGVCNTCASGTSCDTYLVVEHNGDVYPCDFFVRPELRLGNLLEDEWEALQASDRYCAFAAAKTRWDAACAACPWLRFCHGDCPKNRGGSPERLSLLCEGWRRFYAHALPRLEELAQEVRRARIGL